MHVFMGKVITLSDNAYENLKKLKGDSSFSEIIIKLVKDKKKGSLAKFAGLLNNKEAEDMKKEIYAERKKP